MVGLLQRYSLPELQNLLLLIAFNLEWCARWQHIQICLLCLHLPALRLVKVIIAMLLWGLVILLL